MSKLDELDKEFNTLFPEKIVADEPSNQHVADIMLQFHVGTFNNFARKYYELGKLEEREALKKASEKIRHLPHTETHCTCLEIEKQVLLSTLNNEK